MDSVIERLDEIKKKTKNGGEYWMAREILGVLGYARWETFKPVVLKAVESCRSGSIDPRDHFLSTRKMVKIGSGAKVEIEDVFLTRYACYLIAMNGDSSKEEIASAQRYFAVQTRLQELDRNQINDQERVRLRGRLREATKHLHSAASRSGVKEYPLFHNAGYEGLYSMGLRQVKERKGLKESDDLYDHAGRLELSANEFKAQLTEQSLIQKNIQGDKAAQDEHRRVGQSIRDTIHKELGVNLENLKAEPPIRAIERRQKKELPPSGEPPATVH
jgi:DNA-damage-inducible protein D